jgi:hypothetical protein
MRRVLITTGVSAGVSIETERSMREVGDRCGNAFYAKPFSDDTLPFAKTGSGQT